MDYVIIFLCGLVIGSFLNVCMDRIPKGESVVRPPSHCESCGNRLGWSELVPVLSFLFLKGRCRRCGEKIGWRLPGVEVGSALLLLGLYYLHGANLVFAAHSFFAALLLVIGNIDFRYFRIPNSLIVIGFIAGVIFLFLGGLRDPADSLLGMIAGGLPLLALSVLSPQGMGGGDVKLGALAGFYLGWHQALAVIFLSALLASGTWLLLIAAGIKSRKDPIPFGSFMALSVFIILFWGPQLEEWYVYTLMR